MEKKIEQKQKELKTIGNQATFKKNKENQENPRKNQEKNKKKKNKKQEKKQEKKIRKKNKRNKEKKKILNLKGHQHCITGSRVTAILLNGGIFSISGSSAV